MSFTVAQIAEKIRGAVIGDGGMPVTGFASADNARPGDLTFADKEEYFIAAEANPATAILVSGPFTSASKALILVSNTRVAVARVFPVFFHPSRPPVAIYPHNDIM